VAIVWPCPLAVDAYAAAGREVGLPRPDCPSCAAPLVFWSQYRRHVREAGPASDSGMLFPAWPSSRASTANHTLTDTSSCPKAAPGGYCISSRGGKRRFLMPGSDPSAR
jgi:hypothetical protein